MSLLSLTFLCSFIVLLAVYYLSPHSAKLAILLGASALFYIGFGANLFLLLLLVTIATFGFSLLIPRARGSRHGKLAMALMIAATVAPLFFYKYFNFFSVSAVDLLAIFGITLKAHTLKLAVPVGISFYTFRVLSYLIDAYCGRISVEKNFLKYALYVSYFPQILCGPIERAENFFRQINKPAGFNAGNLLEGSKIIIFGLFKKLVIADSLAVYVDAAYSSVPDRPGAVLIVAAVFFSIQIYCDFSGYTDIAIGMSKALGLDLVENFRRPYFSKNVKEFWARWHISLSTWLRDYIYIPLGGNRCSKPRKYFNIMVTFVVSGLWHGANWTFLAWGVLHGIFLVFHDFLCGGKRVRNSVKTSAALTCAKVSLTFAAVTFAWILFRAESFSHFAAIMDGILNRFSLSYSAVSSIPLPFTEDNTSIAHFIVAAFFIGVLFADSLVRELGALRKLRKFEWIYYSFILASILCFGRFGESTFIYAQF